MENEDKKQDSVPAAPSQKEEELVNQENQEGEKNVEQVVEEEKKVIHINMNPFLTGDEQSQSIFDQFQRGILEMGLTSLIKTFNQMDHSDLTKSCETLYKIIEIKKELKRNFKDELYGIYQLTIRLDNKESTKIGLDCYYKVKEILPVTDVEAMCTLYQYICSAEMILGNSDTSEYLLEEAINYLKDKEIDKNKLMISGLVRQRTKIYETRGQHKEYVDDLKLSISMLESVDPTLYTDFHDKYIAQMAPQYIEVEMEKLKIYDLEQQGKYLRKAYDIWKVREGEIPKDFCNFKTTYLLLVLYSKFKQPDEYKDILTEATLNLLYLKPMIASSHQYMNIYFKTSFLLAALVSLEKHLPKEGESEAIKEDSEANNEEVENKKDDEKPNQEEGNQQNENEEPLPNDALQAQKIDENQQVNES